MGERPLEIIGAIEMSCETIRVTLKRVVCLVTFVPILILISPMVFLVVSIVALADTDSCEELKDEVLGTGKEYLATIVSGLRGT